MSFLIGIIRLSLALAALGASALAILALGGFAFPYLDLFNHFQPVLAVGTALGLLAILLFFRRGRMRRVLASIVGVGLLASLFVLVPETMGGFAARPVPAAGHAVLRVMTHNVFGLNEDMERVARVVKAENPDIVAFQEFFPEQNAALTPLLKPDYPYYVRCKGGKRANLALFSRIKFAAGDEQDCPDASVRGQRTAHIVIEIALADGRKLSLLTTHLDWPLPAQRQIDEFSALVETVKDIEGPLVVMGDFNSTPWSYALRRFGDETGLTRQTRNIWTFPMRFWIKGWRDTLPLLPLDHVFTRGLSVTELHPGAATGSDHLPIIFDVSVD